MVQPGDGARLGEEPRERVRAVGVAPAQELERDRTLEPQVHRLEDATHAALAGDLLEAVRAEHVARARLDPPHVARRRRSRRPQLSRTGH